MVCEGHQHLCRSLCIPKPQATYNMPLVGHEFCRVYAGKWLVGSGVHPPPLGGGGVIWGTVRPGVGGTVVPWLRRGMGARGRGYYPGFS